MKNTLIIIVIALFASTIASAEEISSSRDSVSLTIYTDDFALVHDYRNARLPRGNSILTMDDFPASLISSSVSLSLDADINKQLYAPKSSYRDLILKNNIGSEIILSYDKEGIVGKLLSYNYSNALLQTSDGFMNVSNLEKYNITAKKLPDDMNFSHLLNWELSSKSQGVKPLILQYHCSGISWNANYKAIVSEDEKSMTLAAMIEIKNNTHYNFDKASINLVAGSVNIEKKIFRNYGTQDIQRSISLENAYVPNAIQSNFSDLDIIKLHEKHDVLYKQDIQLGLFDAKDIKVNKKYYFFGNIYEREAVRDAAIVYEFKNDKENNLGRLLPEGTIRFYKPAADSDEHIFIGEKELEQNPDGSVVKVQIGESARIRITELQYNKKNKLSGKKREIEYKVKISNRFDTAIELNYLKTADYGWEMVDSDLEYERVDSRSFKIVVKVEPMSTVEFEYKVRVDE